MKHFVTAVLILAAATVEGTEDPAAACAAAHADDPAARIDCLETALAACNGTLVVAPPGEPEAAPELGEEQLRRTDDGPPPEVRVRIVSARYGAGGLGTFRMADGQVWRETMSSPERYRLDAGREYDARIVRGKFGGYRLHVEGVRRMKTVERLE